MPPEPWDQRLARAPSSARDHAGHRRQRLRRLGGRPRAGRRRRAGARAGPAAQRPRPAGGLPLEPAVATSTIRRASPARSRAAARCSTSPPTIGCGCRSPRRCTAPTSTARARCCVAAAEAGVARIVYTSSVATLGLPADGGPADETTPSTLGDMIGHYKRSKFVAEQAVRELIARARPAGRDRQPLGAGRPPRRAPDADRADGPGGGARAHAGLCRHRPQPGPRRRRRRRASAGLRARPDRRALHPGRTGPDARRDPGADRRAWSGAGRRALRLPAAALLPVALVAEALARLRRAGEPLVTVDGVRMARKPMYFSSAKAARELGYRARPAEAALADAIAWYRARGDLG